MRAEISQDTLKIPHLSWEGTQKWLTDEVTVPHQYIMWPFKLDTRQPSGHNLSIFL